MGDAKQRMTKEPDRTFTYREIYGQPEALRETLRRASARFADVAEIGPLEHFTDVIFTGCGSSHHIALYAAHVWGTMLGLRARALPASELVNFPQAYLRADARPLLWAISRSGGTDETVLAAERTKAFSRATIIALTTDPQSALGRAADVHLVFSECPEHSLVTTGSLTCMMLGLLLLADAYKGGSLQAEAAELPEQIARGLREHELPVRAQAEDMTYSHIIFLGSGPFYALAAEAALKMIEMARTPAHFYPLLEFRHGPHLLLSPETLVIIFPAHAERPYVGRVLQEVRSARARAWVLSERTWPEVEALAWGGSASELLRPILLAPCVQQFAFWRAIAVGANPDAPPQLARAVRWDE